MGKTLVQKKRRSVALTAFMQEAPVVLTSNKGSQHQKKHKLRDDSVFYDLEEDGKQCADDPSSDEDHVPAVSVRVPRNKKHGGSSIVRDQRMSKITAKVRQGKVLTEAEQEALKKKREIDKKKS